MIFIKFNEEQKNVLLKLNLLVKSHGLKEIESSSKYYPAKMKAIFNVSKEIELFFKQMYTKPYIKAIVKNSLNNKKQKEIGSIISINYRKVAQIEGREKKKFLFWLEKNKILIKISLLENNTSVLTLENLKLYFQNYTNDFLFFSKKAKSCSFIYNSELNSYIINIENRMGIYKCLEGMPLLFEKNNLEKIVSCLSKECNLSTEIIKKIIGAKYLINGNVYYCNHLYLKDMCCFILKKYYPDGIKVYNAFELNKFYSYLELEFENTKIKNSKALTYQICRVGILCDKGTYKPLQKKYIPNDLYEKICSYILYSDKISFSTNTIFQVFEKDLKFFGINNKYYMQGVLHKLAKNKFVFQKDYISKKAT